MGKEKGGGQLTILGTPNHDVGGLSSLRNKTRDPDEVGLEIIKRTLHIDSQLP
jgi:hypothetical protein